MIDWTIIFHSPLVDFELEELATNASEHGIADFAINESRRILRAETEREDEAINWIAEWLGNSLFQVEEIAQIKEERVYWPEFEEEEPRYEIDFEGGLSKDP